MDFKLLAKIGGTLAVLTIASTCIASVILYLSMISSVFRYISISVCFILAIILGILVWRGTDSTPKYAYIFSAFMNVLIGLIWFWIKNSFHTNSSYLSKVTMYYLFFVAYLSAIACFWNLITRKIFAAELVKKDINVKQETLLYVVLVCLYAILIACLAGISSKDNTYIASIAKYSLLNSIYAWFASGILSVLFAILLIREPKSTKGYDSMVAPISNDADFKSVT
ncbi:hypothetical protein TVAGG3_0004590 [Trichomonas vaginalis G3]|uniref:hypothetical protein n=1 Tax=Trichomonas vaginalis (strain ATCC PRA-98 / G3) TaxID=412133 RepID=UPI0021E57F3D|nr:hypothetical protein TVAGG3_0004590 [Trichomonas vaginalis G3]KAI5538824.1 hypothetical protein TVAGG3_0004590 [Trichomonas vaginalis G3]